MFSRRLKNQIIELERSNRFKAVRPLMAIFGILVIATWLFSGWPEISKFPPRIEKAASAGVCGFGAEIAGGQCRGYIVSAATISWSVPSDWNNNNNTIEVIGGGGGGGAGGTGGGGGGGGAYASSTNVNLGTVSSVTVGVGSGGQAEVNGYNTWFNAANFAACVSASVCVSAGGGVAGVDAAFGMGSGYAVGNGVKYGGAGGTGSSVGTDSSGGGGGAGAPGGMGKNGGDGDTAGNEGSGGGGGAGGALSSNGSNGLDKGGNGGNGPLGYGGGLGGLSAAGGNATSTGAGGGGSDLSFAGGNGGNGAEWDATHGAGGGGGGSNVTPGGRGGLYGGGAGGVDNTSGVAMGGGGIIVITYTPTPTVTRIMRLFQGYRIKLVSGRLIIFGASLCGGNQAISFGGLTYCVIMAKDGIYWLDRNLGATQVATSKTDWLAYGSLFQWGRAPDGHQLIAHTSATAATAVNDSTAAKADIPGNALFITSPIAPNDWRVTPDDTLWASAGSTNNPCPSGYRPPTQAEWAALATAEGITNGTSDDKAFASSLKFTLAGLRVFTYATLSVQGSYGYYWSSSATSTNAYYLSFSSTIVNPANYSSRAYGFSVRCLQEPPPCGADTVCGKSCPFNGLTYGTVNVGSQCFMDRNLGATQVATSYDDYLSYGSLYQWGRLGDGHQLMTCTDAVTCSATNGMTSTGSAGDVPGHGNFISTSTPPTDWRNSQNNTLWQSPGYVNNPCPSGWHVPLQTEWATAMTTLGLPGSCAASSQCHVAVANSTLKLPAAGMRNNSSGLYTYLGTGGKYWSSSPSTISPTTSSYLLFFTPPEVNPADPNARARGAAVRCLKN